METQGLNLFIVDDNQSMVTALNLFLQNKFGTNINITTFNDGESCLLKVNETTHVVILDHYLHGRNGLEILKEIKLINPKTEVIMLSSNEDMALAIESFRAGATDYVVKGRSSWGRITKLVTRIITAPIRLIIKEFGLTKYMAIFLCTFILVGIAVFIALYMSK